MVLLEGLLVDLVPYGEAFLELDYKWVNNESTFWGSVGERVIVSKAHLKAEQREWLDSERPRTGVPFGVQTKDGKPLGYFGINWMSYWHRTAELGAKIGEPEYWSGGYGTDALLLVIDYAFDWLDVRRLHLETMSLNKRVLRQMQKVGFTVEARRRHGTIADGRWYDLIIYGMLREEWPGRETMIETLGLTAP